jgi:hypothetical protein
MQKCIRQYSLQSKITVGDLIQILYSLRSIILFAKVDVSRHILVVDTFVFVKSNMGRREY